MMSIAEEMQVAVAREAGAVRRYDAARKVYRQYEKELLGPLNRVARGSARAFVELDSLRKSPLAFPATIKEGHVDYSRPGKSFNVKHPNWQPQPLEAAKPVTSGQGFLRPQRQPAGHWEVGKANLNSVTALCCFSGPGGRVPPPVPVMVPVRGVQLVWCARVYTRGPPV